MKDEEIKDRWKTYFEKLLKEKHMDVFVKEGFGGPGESLE